MLQNQKISFSSSAGHKIMLFFYNKTFKEWRKFIVNNTLKYFWDNRYYRNSILVYYMVISPFLKTGNQDIFHLSGKIPVVKE